MINDPRIIERIKNQIKNISFEELDNAINKVEEKENNIQYNSNMSISIEIKDEFFDFNTYSEKKTSQFANRFLKFDKKENKNHKEINILEAA